MELEALQSRYLSLLMITLLLTVPVLLIKSNVIDGIL